MSSVWKRLKRVNKLGSKFRISAAFNELVVEGTSKWHPNKLSVMLARRHRRYATQHKSWEPTIRNPYRGLVYWPLPEILEFEVTLFRDRDSGEFERKKWLLSVDDVAGNGRRRLVASVELDLSRYVGSEGAGLTQHDVMKLPMNCASSKVQTVQVSFTMTCQLLGEGTASLAGMSNCSSQVDLESALFDTIDDDADLVADDDKVIADDLDDLQALEADTSGFEDTSWHELSLDKPSLDEPARDEIDSPAPRELQLPVNEFKEVNGISNPVGPSDLDDYDEDKSEPPTPVMTSTPAKKLQSDSLSPTERPKLMTRKQLLNPFDSDSDEEIELCAARSKSSNSEASSPTRSVDEQTSQIVLDSVKEPIRRPLKYAYNKKYPSTTSSSSSSSSSSSTSSPSPSPSSRHFASSNSSAFPRMVEPVELAPGLLDLSPTKAFRLQRANSAPTSHSLLVDPRRRPLSRQEELTERVRKLLEETRKEAIINKNTQQPTRELTEQEMERQKRLRERARKLIAEARQGMSGLPWSSLESPTSPVGLESASSLVANNNDESHNFNRASGQADGNKTRASRRDVEINGNDDTEDVDIKLLNNLNIIRRHSNQFGGDEIDALEREEQKVDREAARLEKKLRRVMSEGGNRGEEEADLMEKWFTLVNKRNAIIRREMQLNILEKEAEVNKRFELLNKELRLMDSIEDFQKTEAQKQREKILLEELVKIVNARNELVLHLDTQERAIEEDELVERDTSGPLRLEDPGDKSCAIQ